MKEKLSEVYEVKQSNGKQGTHKSKKIDYGTWLLDNEAVRPPAV